MDYEWDCDKRLSTLEERGIDFKDMCLFEWDTALTEESPRDGEMRYISIGYIGEKLHAVVHTPRSGVTRIISLRRASNEERERYAQA